MRSPARTLLRRAMLGAMACSLAACSWFGGDDDSDPYADPYAKRSAAEIYAEAEAQLEDGKPKAAGATLEELERVHPYSEWAKRAMILSAYSYHRAGEMAKARLAAKRFIDFFPSDPEAPYAQYIIGLTWYDAIVDVARDQSSARRALEELQKVVQRYPNSKYARDAQLKIDLCNDQLAGKEMMIGRYYLGQRKRVAAINRFKTVLTRYQTTSHAPEALHRLVEAYLELGLATEAQTAGAVLGYNFPGSEWYEASYAMLKGADLAPFEDRESWISRAFRQITTGSTL